MSEKLKKIEDITFISFQEIAFTCKGNNTLTRIYLSSLYRK